MAGKGGSGLKLGRIVRVRKDGNDAEFVAWNGEKRKAKYAPFATVYGRKNDRGWVLSVAIEKNASFNPAEEWQNLYLETGVTVQVDEAALRASAEERNARYGKGGGSSRGQSRSSSNDDNEGNPFE